MMYLQTNMNWRQTCCFHKRLKFDSQWEETSITTRSKSTLYNFILHGGVYIDEQNLKIFYKQIKNCNTNFIKKDICLSYLSDPYTCLEFPGTRWTFVTCFSKNVTCGLFDSLIWGSPKTNHNIYQWQQHLLM